jgi:phage terminase large subunit-like protein
MPFTNYTRFKLFNTIYPALTAGQEQLLRPLCTGEKRVIWMCGRQVGKTELLARLVVDLVLDGKQILWVAPTHDLAQIGYERTAQRFAQFLQLYNSTYRKFARYKNSAPYHIKWLYTGGMCKWLTAKNYRQLQGYTLDWVVVDESASIDDLQHILDSYLIPTISVRMGGILLASTPRGYGDFAKLAESDEYAVVHITTQDGGLVSQEFLDEQRERYRKRGAEHLFEQEFLGTVIRTAGRYFTREPIISDTLPQWSTHTRCVIGVDWGYTSPFACVRVITDGQKYYVDEMVYETKLTPEQQAERLVNLAKTQRNTTIVIDPSTPDSAIKTYKLYGVAPKPAHNDRIGGWQLIRDLLEHDRLWVSPKCHYLLDEWSEAEYNIKRTDDLIAESDHALDALRYAIAECYQRYTEPQPITYHTLLQQQPRKYQSPTIPRKFR